MRATGPAVSFAASSTTSSALAVLASWIKHKSLHVKHAQAHQLEEHIPAMHMQIWKHSASHMFAAHACNMKATFSYL